MVEIEEACQGKYAVWIDGNEPSKGVLYSLSMGPGMDELGISQEQREKNGLLSYADRLKMGKTELWCRLLSAQLERELMDAGAPLDEFDGFVLKPQGAEARPGTRRVIEGVEPSNERRRTTYAQTVLVGPPSHGEDAKSALRTALQKLYFQISEPSDYDYYDAFERQCRQMLKSAIPVSRYISTIMSHRTGIQTYRTLPMLEELS